MKKLAILFSVLFLCTQVGFADEVQGQASQTQTVEANKAVFEIQKQPVDANSTQKQNVKNNWFCVVIQINGKIKE